MAFDPTNRVKDASYQTAVDPAALSNDTQILANCTTVQTYFGLNHSIINGEHSGLTLSGFGNQVSGTASPSATTPTVGTWVKNSFPGTTGGSPAADFFFGRQYVSALYLTASKRTSGAGVVETAVVFAMQNGTVGGSAGSLLNPTNVDNFGTPQQKPYIGAMSVDGGTYSIVQKGIVFSSDLVASASLGGQVNPNTFAGGITGMAVTKEHYNQKQNGLQLLYNNIKADHDAVTGVSSLNATHPYGDGMLTAVMPAGDGYNSGTTTIKQLMPHNGAFPVWTFNVVPQSGFTAGTPVQVVVRPGFDDKNVYGCITGISGGPISGENYTLQATYYNVTTPANYPSLVVTSPAQLYYSYGINIDSTELTAVLQLISLYNLEHNWIGGGHKVPLPRLPGATLITGSCTVSGSVGTTVKVAIDTVSSSYFYYLPAMVGGAAGCGIVDAGIGTDNANVYLLATRRTTGSSNTFNYSVLKISDS